MNNEKINEKYLGYKMGYKMGKWLVGKEKAKQTLIEEFNSTTDADEKIALAQLIAELKF